MKKHVKRLAAPRSWKIGRKTHTWAVRPRPGAHKFEDSIPLIYVFRDILKIADNHREVKRMLKEGKVLVDGKIASDPKRSVGLMDIIETPLTKKRYVVLVDKKGFLALEEIKKQESKTKMLKIVNKTLVKGGLTQLNMHDGRNLVMENEKAKNYQVNDTLIVSLKDNSIKKHLKHETGALAFVTKGSHRGEVGKITQIRKIKTPMPNITTLEKKGKEFKTIEDYILVVGKDKPLLSVMK